jgi:hypothetical protein
MFTNPFSPKYPPEAKKYWRQTAEDSGGTFVPEAKAESGDLPYEARFEAEILSQPSIEDLTDKELGQRIKGAEKMVISAKKNGTAQEIADAKYYLSMLKVEAENRGRRVRIQDPDTGEVEYLARL